MMSHLFACDSENIGGFGFILDPIERRLPVKYAMLPQNKV